MRTLTVKRVLVRGDRVRVVNPNHPRNGWIGLFRGEDSGMALIEFETHFRKSIPESFPVNQLEYLGPEVKP